jgi:hypothetical protein
MSFLTCERGWRRGLIVECLLSKCEALSSNSSTTSHIYKFQLLKALVLKRGVWRLHLLKKKKSNTVAILVNKIKINVSFFYNKVSLFLVASR